MILAVSLMFKAGDKEIARDLCRCDYFDEILGKSSEDDGRNKVGVRWVEAGYFIIGSDTQNSWEYT